MGSAERGRQCVYPVQICGNHFDASSGEPFGLIRADISTDRPDGITALIEQRIHHALPLSPRRAKHDNGFFSDMVILLRFLRIAADTKEPRTSLGERDPQRSSRTQS